jgi:hypothetical protein
MRVVPILFLAFAFVGQPSYGQTLQERVAAAQRRWAEYQELMGSKDPIERSEGFNAALADENLGVRNNAVWTYLHRRDQLPIEIVLGPGSRIGPGDVPNLTLYRVTWNEDQRALIADMRAFNWTGRTSGQVVAGKLQLHYATVRMPSFIGQSNSTSTKIEFVSRVCDTILSPNESRDALEGKLSCEGMPETFQVRMPLG